MIHTGRLSEFVDEVVTIRNEEVEDQALWECWLHKDFERSFADYREAVEQSTTAEASEEDLADIIKQSQTILSFVLPEEG